MSYLVSDFLINPVLRQARRFSRSSANRDYIDPVTNQRTSLDTVDTHHEASINEVNEPPGVEFTPEDGRSVLVTGASEGPIVASPVEEHGGLETELAAREPGRVRSASDVIEPSSVPLRLSYSSDNSLVDEDISGNPSFGIPERFQNDSPTSASFSNLTHPSARMSPGPPSRRSTQDIPITSGSGVVNRHRNGSLPEDDGMSALRRRIVFIQGMELSAEEKARLMHQLLTEGYTHSQIGPNVKAPIRTYSPSNMVSHERTLIPLSLSPFSFWQSSTDTPPNSSSSNSDSNFQLSPEDLEPTFAPMKPSPESSDQAEACEEETVALSLGCKHYKRNVKLQCSTCYRWYTCRLCHDEVEDHVLIRTETKNMLCMLCGCAQRAGELCTGCGSRAAWYYCGVCKLWDDDMSKSIYHCNDCGICRVGRGLGKDFFHCKTCGLCMSISMEQSHKCIERSTDCDCPICGEYMFTSPQTVVFMRCGHTIHRSCYYAHLKSSYKCPICSQSVVNMETQFRNLDRAIESQPMPPQFQDTKAMVSCNDCRAKSAVKYHWLGLKCAVCDSYNTAQLQIITDPAVSTVEVVENIPIPQIETENADLVASDGRGGIHIPGPTRSRRHSSHVLATPGEGNYVRFSPYPLPQRLGRSVSPLRGLGLFEDLMIVDDPDETALTDDEDDRDYLGTRLLAVNNSSSRIYEDQSDEEDDSETSEMDEGDDGDEVDDMELFGHR